MIAPGTPDNIARAAELLRSGEIVIIPTETVYGLAGDAMNADAVRRIFEAKGRPADNPLIVHVSGLEAADKVVASMPAYARELAKAFWPGPLTLVLPKRPEVPEIATGGLQSVGVRSPAHPVTQELLRVSGLALAAPSANPFMALSPTRVEDLDPSVVAKAAIVLDGGPCRIGLESCVLDCMGRTPTMLRPGALSREMLESALGMLIADASPPERRSPGLYARHYAPRARLELVAQIDAHAAGLTFGAPQNRRQISMPAEPAAYAAKLYAALHQLDAWSPEEIQVETPPETTEWEAVHDRLRRAATAG